MNEIQRQLYRVLYKKSFYEFVKAFWHCADPAPFIDGILIEYYCEVAQYMCRGWFGYKPVKTIELPKSDNVIVIDIRKENKRNLNLNIPPRHSKSIIFNIMLGVWVWVNLPLKVASISHRDDLAKKMNTGRKNIINSSEFKFFFPEIELITNTNSQLTDSRGGELYSINRNAFTGYGADIIVNDDLTNAEVARKDKEEMDNAWAYFENTMPSRINNVDTGVIFNIQQRLAPNDITGHILDDPKLRDEYIFITLPAIFEKDTYIVFPISGKIHKFSKGDSLWKERFGDYKSLRNQVGETIFQTQYLQKPIASDRTIVKENMIVEVNGSEADGFDISTGLIDTYAVDTIYASHDFPVKDKEKSDNLGSILAYKYGAVLYIVDALERKMSYTSSLDYVQSIDNLYPGSLQVIEDKANGAPIIQQLQDIVPGIQVYSPGTNSKTQRLESATNYIRNIRFVRTIYDRFTDTWKLSNNMENLRKRLISFPFVDHDDLDDAFSQLVAFVFMDKKYMVYGKSFSANNIIKDIPSIDFSTIFFNKEGDIWKIVKIGIHYGEKTTIIVLQEDVFKASLSEGISLIKDKIPNETVIIDCSSTPAMNGLYHCNLTIERYELEDFEKSIQSLDMAFYNETLLIDNHCKQTINDIEKFKFAKTKDTNDIKYRSDKDGLCACLRVALAYYGIS